MSKKTLILDCALGLFNQQGSMHVTTNHIALAANVSPGNLYYHFRNKEAIILALVQRMVMQWNDKSTEIMNQRLDFDFVESQLSRVFDTVWQYRFIHRELSPLMQAYPSVKSFCVPILKGRAVEIQHLLFALNDEGIVKTETDRQRQSIAQLLLFIPLFWQNYLDATGEEPNKANIQKGVDMMRHLLTPYLARPVPPN